MVVPLKILQYLDQREIYIFKCFQLIRKNNRNNILNTFIRLHFRGGSTKWANSNDIHDYNIIEMLLRPCGLKHFILDFSGSIQIILSVTSTIKNNIKVID